MCHVRHPVLHLLVQCPGALLSTLVSPLFLFSKSSVLSQLTWLVLVQFQTFAERLSAVNVDIIHRLDVKRNTIPEETETFFFECLQKWEDLNCTDGYTVFIGKLGRDVQSLAQLLLNEDRVLNLLLEHIDKDNILFLEPILE